MFRFTTTVNTEFCYRPVSWWRMASWWRCRKAPGSYGTSSSSPICCSVPRWKRRLWGESTFILWQCEKLWARLSLTSPPHPHSHLKNAKMMCESQKVERGRGVDGAAQESLINSRGREKQGDTALSQSFLLKQTVGIFIRGLSSFGR